jgi:hypothetical protein
MFYIGTAGSRSFGRGDTITDLHCSEVGFWEDPKKLTAGLFQAVPRSGTIILESTGNGRNWWFQRVMDAERGKGRYVNHFFNWIDFPEYDLPLTDEEAQRVIDTLDPDLEEDYLYHEVGLTPGQIQFRRERLEDLDYDLDLFKQEYPITLDECFRATGRSIFHKVRFVQSKDWTRISTDLWGLRTHPRKHGRYIIGADPAGGVGADDSVAEIVDLDLHFQAAEYISSKIAPDEFGYKLAALGHQYNDAFIVVENNQYGTATLEVLKEVYPRHLLFRKLLSPNSTQPDHILNYGLLQTSRVKPYSIGVLRRLLATSLTIYSPTLKSQLDSFIEDENNKLRAEGGSKDDCVMAMAALAYGFERASMIKASNVVHLADRKDPFLVANMIEELKGRRKKFPIQRHILL